MVSTIGISISYSHYAIKQHMSDTQPEEADGEKRMLWGLPKPKKSKKSSFNPIGELED